MQAGAIECGLLAVQIEAETAEIQAPRLSRMAPQHRPYARQQDVRVDWLDDKIIGAGVEASQLFMIFIKRGQHQDQARIRGADLAADAETVQPRQHDVEYH